MENEAGIIDESSAICPFSPIFPPQAPLSSVKCPGITVL